MALGSVLAATAAWAGPRRAAVLPVHDRAALPAVERASLEGLVAGAMRSRNFLVVTGAMLTPEERACIAPTCIAALARKLDVDAVIALDAVARTGSSGRCRVLVRVGGRSGELLQESKVVDRQTAEGPCDAGAVGDQVLEALDAALERSVAGYSAPAPSRTAGRSSPSLATLTAAALGAIPALTLGTGPLAMPLDLAAGALVAGSR